MRLFNRVIGSLNARYDLMGDGRRLAWIAVLALPGIAMAHLGCAVRQPLVLLLGILWLAFLFCARMAWLRASRSERAG